MSSTSNYGYEANFLDQIDRDIKRVEDKADRNAATKVDKVEGYSLISTEKLEQIIHNQNHIECLGKRVDRADSDIADRYTKSEVDAKFDCATGKSALEDHMVDPLAHQELFDQKIDKRDGYDLVSDDEITQIATNKSDIAILNDRVTTNETNISKTYTQEEVNALLSNKANAGVSALYDIPLASGITTIARSTYWKDEFGTVFVYLHANKSSGNFVANQAIATLPVGFRPVSTIQIIASYGSSPYGLGGLNVSSAGNISPTPSGTLYDTVQCFISFQAAQ